MAREGSSEIPQMEMQSPAHGEKYPVQESAQAGEQTAGKQLYGEGPGGQEVAPEPQKGWLK